MFKAPTSVMIIPVMSSIDTASFTKFSAAGRLSAAIVLLRRKPFLLIFPFCGPDDCRYLAIVSLGGPFGTGRLYKWSKPRIPTCFGKSLRHSNTLAPASSTHNEGCRIPEASPAPSCISQAGRLRGKLRESREIVDSADPVTGRRACHTTVTALLEMLLLYILL